jgi:cytoskeletal protein CcmA (bactofilin family)
LFAHDDQYDDQPDFQDSSSEAVEEAEWQQPTPSWRNRIPAADESGDIDGLRRRGTSIISEDASFTGTLRSEDPLYIEGTFDGEIIASSDVTIARGAHVKARIQAIRMTVAGTLDGAVACTDRFEAVDTGVVTAEILSPVFVIHDGATVNGTLKMRLDSDGDPDLASDIGEFDERDDV